MMDRVLSGGLFSFLGYCHFDENTQSVKEVQMKSEKGEKYNWHVILFLPVKTMYISRFLNLTSKRGCLD